MEVLLRLHFEEGHPTNLYYYLPLEDQLLDPYLFVPLNQEVDPDDITIANLQELNEIVSSSTSEDEPLVFIYTGFGFWAILNVDYTSREIDLSLASSEEDLVFLAAGIIRYELFLLYEPSIPEIIPHVIGVGEQDSTQLAVEDLRLLFNTLHDNTQGLFQLEDIATALYEDDEILAPFTLWPNLREAVNRSANDLEKGIY